MVFRVWVRFRKVMVPNIGSLYRHHVRRAGMSWGAFGYVLHSGASQGFDDNRFSGMLFCVLDRFLNMFGPLARSPSCCIYRRGH